MSIDKIEKGETEGRIIRDEGRKESSSMKQKEARRENRRYRGE